MICRSLLLFAKKELPLLGIAPKMWNSNYY